MDIQKQYFFKEQVNASVIISVYSNVEALKVVLESLKDQTVRGFEVIVSEDAEHQEMKEFLDGYPSDFPILHLTQKDQGWRKNQALNKAIVNANGEYLIFIDGDCVLHPRFVEFHLKLAEDGYVLAGKRIKLDSYSSSLLINKSLSAEGMNKYIFRKSRFIKKNGGGFVEEGYFFDPSGIWGFIPRLRSMYQLKGCNMSCSKKAIYAINGFDEDYIRPAIGEDIDLTWRFEKAGYRLKSVRNLAVQYHLYHKENWIDQSENIKEMEEKKARNEYICKNGIDKIQ